jgi:hypothetical protein
MQFHPRELENDAERINGTSVPRRAPGPTMNGVGEAKAQA